MEPGDGSNGIPRLARTSVSKYVYRSRPIFVSWISTSVSKYLHWSHPTCVINTSNQVLGAASSSSGPTASAGVSEPCEVAS